jgi:hypothetical protein
MVECTKHANRGNIFVGGETQMGTNYDTLMYLWANDPEKFFVEFMRGSEDNTLSQEDISKVISKLEKDNPVDYAKACKILKLNNALNEHKIICHYISYLMHIGEIPIPN